MADGRDLDLAKLAAPGWVFLGPHESMTVLALHITLADVVPSAVHIPWNEASDTVIAVQQRKEARNQLKLDRSVGCVHVRTVPDIT